MERARFWCWLLRLADWCSRRHVRRQLLPGTYKFKLYLINCQLFGFELINSDFCITD